MSRPEHVKGKQAAGADAIVQYASPKEKRSEYNKLYDDDVDVR